MPDLTSTSIAQRERRARLAYELGRVRWGLPRALVALPVGVLAFGAGVSLASCALLAGLLFTLVTLAAWRSKSALHGAWAGLGLSTIPLVVAPLTMQAMHAGHLCGSSVCVSLCALLSGALGAAGGLWIGKRLNRLTTGRLHFLVAGAVSLSATSLFVCSAVGFGAIGGLALGVVGGVAPALSTWLGRRAAE